MRLNFSRGRVFSLINKADRLLSCLILEQRDPLRDQERRGEMRGKALFGVSPECSIIDP